MPKKETYIKAEDIALGYFTIEAEFYRLPSGTKRLYRFVISNAYEPAYNRMREAGFKFTFEALTTNEMACYVSPNDEEDEDADIEIVPPGMDFRWGFIRLLERGRWDKVLDKEGG